MPVAPSATSPRRAHAELDAQPPSGRYPLVVHLMSLASALVLIAHVDWHEWFFLDDWDYLVRRGLHHPVLNIWYPHNEHWDTIPVLAWRALYSIVGLHQFWPYLGIVLVAHLALAHVIWRVCLNEGLDPWISTAFCALFALLGAGAENLVWAAGIEFVWSMLFGYLALSVASGRRAWRYPAASISAFVLASMMCSATGNVVAVAVAVVLLARVGWRFSARALWFPVACYSLWYALEGHQALVTNGDQVTSGVIGGIPDYLWTGFSGSLGVTFGWRAAGGALLIALLVVVALRFEILRRIHPVVLGSFVGAPTFFILASIGRERLGLVNADASRYIYVAIAFVLPLLVFATDWLVRNLAPARLAVYALVGFLIVTNYSLLESFSTTHEALVVSAQHQILADATVLAEGAQSLPVAPVTYAPALTPNALRNLVATGQLSPEKLTTTQRFGTELGLDVSITTHPVFSERFRTLLLSEVTVAAAGTGCVAFTPTGPHPRVMLAPGPDGSSGSLRSGTYQPVTVALFTPGAAVGPSKTWGLPKSGVAQLNAITAKNLYPILSIAPGLTSTMCGVVPPPSLTAQFAPAR